MEIYELLDKYNYAKGKYDTYVEQQKDIEEKYIAAKNLRKVIQDVSIIVQQTAKETQEQIKLHINALVTQALHTVYPEDLHDFELQFDLKRNTTVIEPLLISDGHELDPEDNSIGMSEVIAFALRLALLTIGKKPKFVLLDEPFTAVSTHHNVLMSEFIKQVSEDMGIQILLTSHVEELHNYAHTTYNIVKEGTNSNVY